jgi:hypothetical protein
MPRDGAIIFGDLIGKLEVLRVACDSCGRAGSYRVTRLVEQHDRDAAIVDWLDKIATDLCLLKEEISQCPFSDCEPKPSRLIGSRYCKAMELLGFSLCAIEP